MTLAKPLSTNLAALLSLSILTADILSGGPTRSKIDAYYCLCFALCAGISCYTWWKSKTGKSAPCPRSDLLGLAGITGALGAWYWSFAPTHTLGLDEYTHVLKSLVEPGQGAAVQQQPILGYLLSKSLTSCFGLTLGAVRLTGLLPTLGGFFLFGLGLRRQGAGTWSLLFLAVIFATNDVLRLSALEGRSMGTALFTLAVLWLSWSDLGEDQGNLGAAVLGVSAFNFLCSIGAQPIMGLTTLLGLLLGAQLFGRSRPWRRALIALTLALACYLPIQLYISKIARDFGYIHGPHWDALSPVFFRNLLSYWLPPGKWFVWSLLYLALIPSLRRLWSTAETRLCTAWMLLFPLTFDLVFQLTVSWYMSPRYRVCYIVLLALLLAKLHSWLPHRFFRIAVVLAFGLASVHFGTKTFYEKEVGSRPRWEKLPPAFDAEYGPNGWRAYVVGECATEHTWWCSNIFIGAELFGGSGDVNRMQLNLTRQDLVSTANLLDNGLMSDFLRPWDGRQHVLLVLAPVVVLNGWPPVAGLVLPYQKDGFALRQRGDFKVLETVSPMTAREAIPRALEWLTSELPQSTASYYPYELLAYNYAMSGDLGSAKKTLERLRAIPGMTEALAKNPFLAKKVSFLDQLAEGVQR